MEDRQDYCNGCKWLEDRSDGKFVDSYRCGLYGDGLEYTHFGCIKCDVCKMNSISDMSDAELENPTENSGEKVEELVARVVDSINNVYTNLKKFYFEHKDEIDAKIEEIRESDKHKSISAENVDTTIREQCIREIERKQTAKEILTYVGNLYDDCDQRFRLKDYQWHKDLCKKYGVRLDDTL